jgi:hypothetical protein
MHFGVDSDHDCEQGFNNLQLHLAITVVRALAYALDYSVYQKPRKSAILCWRILTLWINAVVFSVTRKPVVGVQFLNAAQDVCH